jgi:hypothetical protein
MGNKHWNETMIKMLECCKWNVHNKDDYTSGVPGNTP